MVHGTLANLTLTAPAFSPARYWPNSGSPSVQRAVRAIHMNAPMSLIGLGHARLEPVKHRFPERVVVARSAAAIIRCQQVLPMLRCQQPVSGGTISGTNPTATREFGEGAGKRDSRQLVTQWHRYAVKLVVHPQAQTFSLRDLKTLVAALLKPGSEPARLTVIDMRFHILVAPRFQNVAMNFGWLPAGKGEPAMGVSAPVKRSSLKPLILAAPSLAT